MNIFLNGDSIINIYCYIIVNNYARNHIRDPSYISYYTHIILAHVFIDQ